MVPPRAVLGARRAIPDRLGRRLGRDFPRPAMDLSVLIVSYNTRAKTLACLGSIRRETRGLEYEVRVLDNGSRDGSAEAIRAAFPEVRLEALDENLGFGRGVNRLARGARGEYLLLLNPDTEVRDGALQALLAVARERPEPAIHGGRTLRSDGSPDADCAWGRATLWSTFCNAVGLAGLFPRSAWLSPEAVGGRLGPGEREVDIVSGCFFLVPRALWNELGGFDPAFFVYGEEADFCLRARERGYRAWSTSRASVLHHGAASESSLAGKQVKLLEAKRRLMDLHWSPARARLGGRLLELHAGLRALGFSLLALARPARFGARARDWREVWSRRTEWRAPRPAPLEAPTLPARDGLPEKPLLR